MASYIDINPTPTESRQPNSDRLKDLYEILKDNGANVGTSGQFRDWMMKSEDNRRQVYEVFKDNGANVGEQFSDFDTWLYD
jgi:sugar phosphate isomerase/epimerase